MIQPNRLPFFPRVFFPVVFLLLFLSGWIRAQTPSVHAIRHTPSVLEWQPSTVPAPDGSFFVQSLGRKGTSFNDSTFATLTRLNANLEPVWARRIKLLRRTSPYNAIVNADGSLTMLANSFTQTNRIVPLLIDVTADGQLLQTREIVDSSSPAQSLDFRSFTRLGNQAIILVGQDAILRIDPQGQVSFRKKLYIGNNIDRSLNISAVERIPGGNGWIGVGQVGGTNLAFYSRWNDTTLVNVRVYDANMAGLNAPSLGRPHIHPNGEVSHMWNANARELHLHRLQPDGQVLWWRSYKTRTTSPSYLRVSPDGHHWVTGSITPGQAGGLVLHFSPTGDLIKAKGQFKVGSSHMTITTFEPLPNGDFLSLQKGYFANNENLFLNRVGPDLEFRCFDAQLPAITDTSIARIDSAVTNVRYLKKRYGLTTTLTYPLFFGTVSVVKEPVSCTVTDVEAIQTSAEPEIFPNPVTDLVTFSNPGGRNLRWVLRDGLGRLCGEGQTAAAAYTIRTTYLPFGLYTLSLYWEGGHRVHRLVRQ